MTNTAEQNLPPRWLASTLPDIVVMHPGASGDEKIAARWHPALAALLDADAGEPGDRGDPGGPGDPGDPDDPPACAASLRAVASWQGGHQGEVTVTHASASAVSGWAATVVPADGARLAQLWNGTFSAAGDGTATVTNASWNGTLAPGASAGFGFVASTPATAGPPSATVTCTARATSS